MSLLLDRLLLLGNQRATEYYLRKKRMPEVFDENAKELLCKKYADRFTEEEIKAMLPDMHKCYRKYLISADNYVQFDFPNKSARERNRYVSEAFHGIYPRIFNLQGKGNVLRDKYACYRHFLPYYHREMLQITSDEDFDAFAKFTAAHPRFVVKPETFSCGVGVCMKNINDARCPEDLFLSFRFQYPRGAVLEEPIVQSAAMARLHPSSVNTIRAVTLKLKNELKIIFMMLRTGQDGSFVDNGSAGGVFCAVDTERGVVTAAADHTHAEITNHPTTGVPLIGFEIPEFAELKELLRTLADKVEGVNYIGWDLAHTDEGWIMVEANSNPQMNSIQILRKAGIKPTMRKLCRKFRFGF